ncbi:2TM domain-containing protein [Hyunsoonleella flava]|uniref:2TM domain-containing protein n=1 Tax=Hyunsoonleella flava TaxID=2527939 RepID=A0A4Q9FDI8_9FLAO|nr:2TM domain-containing protein [Hyunsoonleella flava]TBN03639.1 2TM domain-containing protein [Hyunsoonleella flava]
MKRLAKPHQNDSFIKAKRRVEALKGFYFNVLAYCLVIPFLIVVNYKTYWEFKWFWFSAIGWGIGIGFHAYRVFVRNPIFGERWEQRKLEQFMREEQNRSI